MRRRTQRILISLLAFFIAGFAMANAYTFEVINWSPFGVLNLEKLILKQKPNSTGIILDGKEYTIKIDPNHETEDGGIWVDRICDESGVNCKKVSELGIGGGGAIVIDGDAENFCFKKDDTTLICDNNFLKRLIESWGLGGSMNIDGMDQQYCYRLQDRNTLYCDNTNLPTGNGSTPGNGKITIIQGSSSRNFNLNDSGDQKITLSNGGGTTNGAIAYGSGEYICVKNGDNLDCSKAKLGELKPDKRCTFDGTSINCIEDKPNGNGGSYTLPSASTTILGGVKLGSDTVQTTTSQSPSTNAGRTYPVQFDKNGRLVVNVPRTSSTNGGSGISMGSYYVDNPNYYCISTDSNSIRCNVPMPSGGGGGGDGLWTGNNYWTYPKNTEMSVAIGPHKNGMGSSSSTGNMRLAVNGNTVIMDGDISVAKLGQNGVAFMGANEFYMGKITNTSSPGGGGRTVNRTYGVSVAGPIAIGYDPNNTGNYIYIYSEGNTGNSARHFEIMGSYELAVGTISGGFIYFNQPQSDNNRKYSIGVNTNDPQATFDINGGLKVGDECTTCTADTYGTIVYHDNDFWGCKPNNQGTPKWTSLTKSGTNSWTTVCNTPSFFHSQTANQTQALAK